MHYTTAVGYEAIPTTGPPDGHHRAEEANVSRVQCLECGIAVVVDPTGICPEGHLVGSAGVRVAGAMGSDVPHPDEPEPWVATVVLDEVDIGPAARERPIRPVQIAGAEAAEAEHREAADHESMLRELHALGDIREATRPSAVPETATAPAPEAPPVAHVPPPPQEQVVEGFAELSALEAAFHALGYDEDAMHGGQQPDTPGAKAHVETGSGDDLADVEGLFASPTATDRTDGRTPAAPAPDRDQVAAHAVAPPASVRTRPTAPDAATPDAAAPPATAEPAEPTTTDADDAPRAKVAGLDITNFTARGSKVGSGKGGRRRLFGR